MSGKKVTTLPGPDLEAANQGTCLEVLVEGRQITK